MENLEPSVTQIYMATKQPSYTIKARLYFYFFKCNAICKDCDIKPSIKTDHSLVTLNLNPIMNAKRGPGFWKFNCSLLKDEVYIDYIKEIIEQLKEQYVDIDNKGLK